MTDLTHSAFIALGSNLQDPKQQVEKALQSKEMVERLGSVGGEISPGSTAQFTAYLNSERKRYEKLVREANIQPD